MCSASVSSREKWPLLQDGLDMLRDLGVVQRVLDVVALAGAAVGQGNIEVELQRLRHALFPLIYADEGDDFEFAQKNNVHMRCVAGRLVAWAHSSKIRRFAF